MSDKASKIRLKTSALTQSRKRLNTVFHLPKYVGKSRHGLPVRAIQNTASKNSRASPPVRPGSLFLPRQCGLFAILVNLFLLPTSAYAYLDPGTGNALGYLLLSGAAAIFFFIKSVYYQIFRKRSNMTVLHKDPDSNIVLFSEGKPYWDTFQPIIEALILRKQKFSYLTMDVEDPGLTFENPYIEPRYIGSGTLAFWRLNRVNARIMLATTPNIGSLGAPLARPPRVKILAHVFHSVADISMYSKGSLDHYDAVLLAGAFQKASIRAIERKRNLPKKRLEVAGLPYLDALAKRASSAPLTPRDRPTVLVGSSWGNKGCLKHYGVAFISGLLNAGYEVVIRPHPHSLQTEPGVLEAIASTLSDRQYLTWDLAPTPDKTMAASDILISDTSSIRLDYAFLYGKPVVTLEIPEQAVTGLELEDLEENWIHALDNEIGVFLGEDLIHTLPDQINSLLEDSNQRSMEGLRDDTLPYFGRSGEIIADYLIREVASPNKENAPNNARGPNRESCMGNPGNPMVDGGAGA